jgi:hypothetical protein
MPKIVMEPDGTSWTQAIRAGRQYDFPAILSTGNAVYGLKTACGAQAVAQEPVVLKVEFSIEALMGKEKRQPTTLLLHRRKIWIKVDFPTAAQRNSPHL